MPKDRSTPLYKTFCLEHETEDAAAEYGAIDVRRAAQLHADYFHRHCDGWEASWPLTFKVFDPERQKWFAVSVEREMVPEFVPGKELAYDELKPAVHFLWGGRAWCEDSRLVGVPANWPEGQQWIPQPDYRLAESVAAARFKVTCKTCLKKIDKHVAFMADVADRKAELDKTRKS